MNYIDVDDSAIKNIPELVKADKIASFVLEYLKKDNSHMSIVFVDDETMRKYNLAYRGIDSTTDVLSFAFCDDNFTMVVDSSYQELGEIYISLREVFDNASKFNVDENQELARVVIHGTLHLLGYDHKGNDLTAEEMLILQEEILSKLGDLCQVR